MIYGIDPDRMYDRELLTRHYLRHNEDVMEYFRGRPASLLVVNLEDGDALNRIGTFLGFDSSRHKLPRLKQTS